MHVLLLVASPFAGWMHDTQGTYTAAFLILAGAVQFNRIYPPSGGKGLTLHQLSCHAKVRIK